MVHVHILMPSTRGTFVGPHLPRCSHQRGQMWEDKHIFVGPHLPRCSLQRARLGGTSTHS